MNHRAFDAVARCAARVRDRRSLLGFIAGTSLAAISQPRDGLANPDKGNDKKGKGGKGGKGGGDKKKKRKSKYEEGVDNYAKCYNYWSSYCDIAYPFDTAVAAQCALDFAACCGLHLRGKDAAAINCVHFLDNEVW